jgi:RNA recognition motif-containing protein
MCRKYCTLVVHVFIFFIFFQGCGIVEFENAEEAAVAIETMNDVEVRPYFAPFLIA